MADAVANLGNGQEQTFPFMKLPPELRLIVYEFAMRSYLQDIERTKFLQCGPPEIGVSLETENKRREAMKLEVAEIKRKRDHLDTKTAPYLGALALLHTSRMVYWESYKVMVGLERCHRIAQYEIMRKAHKRWILARTTQTADLLEYEHESMTAIWSFMLMVDESFMKTLDRRVSLNDILREQAIQSALSKTKSDESARAAAEIRREATLMSAVKCFPQICDKIQCGLEGGAGVRTAFKAEVKSLVRWEITNNDVDIMIKGIAALGASLKTIRGSDCSNRLRNFRVVKRKSRPKRRRSKTSCDPPKTWLSSDEMDTGP